QRFSGSAVQRFSYYTHLLNSRVKPPIAYIPAFLSFYSYLYAFIMTDFLAEKQSGPFYGYEEEVT
ncbi:MAG: hypothetical protein LBH43_05810, partial [Treponema sp.]|nr:hypothetical protein [Treponema sp.]